MIKHTVYYRLTRAVKPDKRGDYFMDVQALNFIHAIDKIMQSFGEDHDAVRIESVRIKPYRDSQYVVFDSENLVR